MVGGTWADERLSYAANDWLMRTMRLACRNPAVSSVHCYEDCSLWQFDEAKRLGKACIYDMPIGYYPAWEETQARLAKQFASWLPRQGMAISRFVRPEQKNREMELADLVLAPSSFVCRTIQNYADRPVALAPYGVDLEFWQPSPHEQSHQTLKFIYAGQCSLRKGTPVLLDAWKSASLPDATLELVGSWHLAENRKLDLPANVNFIGPVSAPALRALYQQSSVFVFPSFFEGFGLVLLEAMACGLPVIATDSTAAPDILDPSAGQIVPTGNVDALVESLRWYSDHREQIGAMQKAARTRAESCTWVKYRSSVSAAVAPFV
jgi:glycosyltransferase involved in cell wall biosynthesis